jgi:hypothetical protein
LAISNFCLEGERLRDNGSQINSSTRFFFKQFSQLELKDPLHYTTNQNLSEDIDAYVLELKKLAAKCAFHAKEHNKLICDRLVWGICDKQLQEELLHDAEFN